MAEFNKMDFGNKIKQARIRKELSIYNVAEMIGKSPSTVSRYEKGEVIPNAEIIDKLCEVLDIYYNDLYSDNVEKIVNIENSINPFGTNKLFLYYLTYRTKTKIENYKLIINLKEKNDYVEVKISDYKNKKVILIGHIISDNFIATIRTENYKPNCPRLETNQII